MDFEKFGNISYGVTYLPTVKRFQFLFPSNNRMTKMKLCLPSDLVERLGFELTEISHPTQNYWRIVSCCWSQSHWRPSKSPFPWNRSHHCVGLQYRNKYNRGQWQTVHGGPLPHWNRQHGALQQNLQSTACHEFVKHEYGNEYIPVTFLLSRFLGHNKLVNLVWKEGFTMQGTLRGVHPLKMK